MMGFGGTRRLLAVLGAGTASLVLAGAVGVAQSTDYTGWPMYGGSNDSTQYSSLTQITPKNIDRVQIAWSYELGDSTSSATPIVVNGVVYAPGKDRSIVALDAETGAVKWTATGIVMRTRGLTYWQSSDRRLRRIIYFQDQSMRALDADTGAKVTDFGTNGAVDLRQGLGRDVTKIGSIQPNTPGKVFGDLLILGSNPGELYGGPPGDIRAYDLRTGTIAWTFHTVPHPGEEGYDSWTNPEAWKTAAAANNWGGMSIDEKRGIVYLPLGSASYDFWGGDRQGANLYADSLVALDARTGRKLWHFQTVHHDLWDYDLTSSPVLMTVRQNGKPVDIVIQATKAGFIFAFERVTGKPLWPIEERPVPKSVMADNPAWPTQPYPTVIEPFARQTFTEKDLDPNLPPEELAAFAAQIRAARNEGIFTPPSTQDTVQMPGNHGGVNWGMSAGDPKRGRFYVASFDLPAILKLELAPALKMSMFTNPRDRGEALYAANCRICHGATLAGQPPAIPALGGIVQRLTLEGTSRVIHEGRNTMPAFGGALSDTDITAIITYLTDPRLDRAPPVATAQQAAARSEDHAASGPVREPAPEGPLRYYSSFGFLLSKTGDPAIRPPWSTLSAYDMNTGKRLWQAPIGSVINYPQKDTGVSRSKGGVVVTASGLVLAASSEDRMIHAWDADTGKKVWDFELPSVPQGVPAVYQVKGRQFVLVPAASFSTGPSVMFPKGFGPKPARNSYVALALPVRR